MVHNQNLVSLFSGCGGFDLGFKAAGFKPIAAFDHDPIAIDHYKRNVGPHAKVADLTMNFPISSNYSTPTILLAGPPCQGFSLAGRRELEDERNSLLTLAGEISLRLRPWVIVVENVAAALLGPHARYWTKLEQRLRHSGYRTHTLPYNGLDAGMAQRRRRLFLIAWRTERDDDIGLKTIVQSRLDHVLAGVESQNNHNPKPLTSGSRLRLISEHIGSGQKLSNVRGGTRSVHTWNIPEVFGHTTAAECELLETVMRIRRSERRRDFGDADPVSINRLEKELGTKTEVLVESLLIKGYLRKIGRRVDLTHTFNGKCRRFRWEDAACTVDTRFGDPNLFLHPNEHRPFTVREAARIQGFSDSFVFDEGVEKDHFRLIGNAVPPPMALSIAGIATRLLGS